MSGMFHHATPGHEAHASQVVRGLGDRAGDGPAGAIGDADAALQPPDLRRARRDLQSARAALAGSLSALSGAARLFNAHADGRADDASFAENAATHVGVALDVLRQPLDADGFNPFDGSLAIAATVDADVVKSLDVATMQLPGGVASRTFHLRCSGAGRAASAELRRVHPVSARPADAAPARASLRIVPAVSLEAIAPVEVALDDHAIDEDLGETVAAALRPMRVKVTLRGDRLVMRSTREGRAHGFAATVVDAASVGAWLVDEVVEAADGVVRVDGRPARMAGSEGEFRHDHAHLLFRVAAPRADGRRSSRTSCFEAVATARGGWRLPVCKPAHAGLWLPEGWRRGPRAARAQGPGFVVGVPALGGDTLGLASMPLGAMTPQDLLSGGVSARTSWRNSIAEGLRQCLRVHARLGEALKVVDAAAAAAADQLRQVSGEASRAA